MTSRELTAEERADGLHKDIADQLRAAEDAAFLRGYAKALRDATDLVAKYVPPTIDDWLGPLIRALGEK